MRLPSAATIVQVLIVLLIQVPLGFFTSICFFTVLLNIVDQGGGASGVEASRRVTVEQRLESGLLFGSLGFLGSLAMVGVNRFGRHSFSPKKTATDEL